MKYGHKQVCLEKILDDYHGCNFKSWFPIQKYEERFYRYDKLKSQTSYIKIYDEGGPYYQMRMLFEMKNMFPLSVIMGQDIIIGG